MKSQILVNGVDSTINPMDRGFQYGDGLFETMAAYQGECPWFDKHFVRLCTGCDQLAIPYPDKTVLYKEIQQVIAAKGRGVVKIIYTRGTGGRGYRVNASTQPTRVVMGLSWPEYDRDVSDKGINLFDCQTPLSCNPKLAGIKHLNRLEQVLASQEWDPGRYSEGLMKDQEGHIIEGVMSNIFFVKQGQIHTPELSHCGVSGLMRAWVIKQSVKNQIHVEIGRYKAHELRDADEIFMTNTLIGLWPVKQYHVYQYSPGPVFRQLLQELVKDYPVIDAQID